MLETGDFTTINELAAHEKIAPSYMTRVLRLTLLAPDIVEAILDGKQGPNATLKQMLDPFPEGWAEQAEHFGPWPDHLPCAVACAAQNSNRSNRPP